MLRSLPTMLKWAGIIVPPEIQKSYQAVIDKLVHGPRNGLDLKRLAGHKNLYSVRVNGADRLLFTTVEYNGQRYFNFCDVVLNHRHDRCALLQPEVLEHHRERDAMHLQANEITADHFISVDPDQCQFPEVTEHSKGAEVVTHYDRSKFFVLNATQEDIATNPNVRFPVVVKGPAGSGKSCVVIAMLTHYAEKYLLCDDDLQKANAIAVKPAICIVKSPRVCAFLQHTFAISPVGLRYTKGQVQFESYDNYIRNNDPNAAKRVEVGRSEFEAFCKEQMAQTKLRERHNKKILSDKFINEVDHYQECRIISGMEHPEDYLKLGEEQSQISAKQEREWLFDVMQRYVDYLDQNNQIDFSFYTPKPTEKYSMVAVDEAVDFSYLELKVLRDLAEKSRVLYCVDENQCLNDRAKKEPYLKKLLNAKDGKMTLVELTGSYRCGKNILEVANNVSALRSKLTSRKLPPMVFDGEFSHPDHVNVITVVDKKVNNLMRELGTQPNFAVVTTQALKPVAIKEFGTDNVFTVEEIKGLEFDTVCDFRLMESALFYEMNKALLVAGSTDDKFIPVLNEYFTACTRAINRLVIIEPAKIKLKNVLTELTRDLTVSVEDIAVNKLSEAEIQEKQLADLRENAARGNEKRARQIAAQMKMPDDEADAIINKLLPVPKEVVVIAEPVKVTAASSKKSNKKNKKKTASPATAKSALFSPKPAATRSLQSKRIPKTTFNVEDLEILASQKVYVHEDINDVFMSPNALTYLFDVPVLKKRTCFLTALADNEVTRHGLMQLLLPAHFMLVGPRLRGPYLNRGYDGGKTLPDVIPLLYWICYYKSTLQTISQSPAFEDFWKVENLSSLTTVVVSKDKYNDGSALYMLAADQSHYDFLHRLIDEGKLAKKLTVKDHLLQKINFTGESFLKLTMIGHILAAGDAGICLLDKMVTQNANLALDLNMGHLMPLPMISDEQSFLYSIIKSEHGRAFIRKVQSINPRFAPFDVTMCNSQECIKLHLTLIPVIREMQKKVDYIKGMLQGFRQGKIDLKQSLAALLTGEKSSKFAYLYFFHIYLEDETDPACHGENLFFHLMYHADTRPIFSEIIAKYRNLFSPYVTSLALVGRKKPQGNVVFPLFWMLSSYQLRSVLLIWLMANTLLSKMLPLEPLYSLFSWEEYQSTGLMSAFTKDDGDDNLSLLPGNVVSFTVLIFLTPTGREIFKQVAYHKCYTNGSLPCQQFTDVLIKDDNNNGHSLLSYCATNTQNNEFIFSLTKVISTNEVQMIPDKVLFAVSPDSADKRSIFSHLMTMTSGVLFIQIIANSASQDRSMMAEYLFSVFDDEGEDDAVIVSEYETFIQQTKRYFTNSDYIIQILSGLIISYPGILTEKTLKCFVAAKDDNKNVSRRVQLAREIMLTKNSGSLVNYILSFEKVSNSLGKR